MSSASTNKLRTMIKRGWDEEPFEFKGSIVKTWDHYTRNMLNIKISDIDNKEFEKRWSLSGHIYLLRWNDGGPDFYKIGSTSDPKKRIASWKATLPDPSFITFLRICNVGTCMSNIETQLILACRDFLLNGEWFREDIGPHRTFIKLLEKELTTI